MARPNGVVIVSERFWAFAARDGDLRQGSHAPRGARGACDPARTRPAEPYGLPLPTVSRWRRRGGEGRALLAAGLLVSFGFVFLPDTFATVLAVALTAILLGVLFRGRTLALHGAEHRAIAAAEERRLQETWRGHAHPSRLSWRCGTNFAALALPISTAVEWLWPLPIALGNPTSTRRVLR